MAIRVYSTKICPNCRKVKEFLAAEGAPFEEVDLTSAEALTELRMHGVFTLVTPIVQIGSTFLTTTDLFAHEELRKERLREVLKGADEV